MDVVVRVFLLLCTYVFLIHSYPEIPATPRSLLKLRRFSEEQASYHGCRCLDGTPSGYYYRYGEEAYKNNWIIVLESWSILCHSKETCDSLSNVGDGKFTSSKKWQDKRFGVSLVDADENFNKDFHEWSHVIIVGCSGDLLSGQQRTKTDDGFYFSGHYTVTAVISDLLNTTGFGNATRLLLSGLGPGAAAVFELADFFTETVHWAEVKAVAVGGFFFPRNVTTYQNWLVNKMETPISRSLYSVYNSYVNEDCKMANADKPYLCGPANVGFLYPYIKTPIYVVQNAYDCAMLSVNLGISEDHQSNDNYRRYLEHFGDRMKEAMDEVSKRTENNDFGLFTPCLYDIHMYAVYLYSKVDGSFYSTLFGNWYFNHEQQQWFRNYRQHCPTVPKRNQSCDNIM